MGNNRFTPSQIVKKGEEFLVPLYQRLYSWKDGNVRKLLDDMEEHFEKSQDEPYYFGMLTCVRQDNKEVLIDGQQRMTVILLMAIIFKKYYDGWSDFLDNGKRIDFFARQEDADYIQWRMAHPDQEPDETQYKNDNMEQTLAKINEFLNEKYDEADFDGRMSFAKNVYEELTFFISRLPDNYSNDVTLLNKYFEAMNSQGKGLEQHEILKVELLKGSGDDGTLTHIWNAVSQMDRLIIEDKDDLQERYKKAISECLKKIGDNGWIQGLNLLGSKGENDREEYKISRIVAKKQDFQNLHIDEGSDSVITFEEFLLMALDIYMDKCYDKGEMANNPKDNNNYTGGKISPRSFYRTDKLLEIFNNDSIIKADVKEKEKFYWHLLYYRLLMDYYVIRREFTNGVGKYTLLISDKNPCGSEESEEDRDKLRQYQSMLYVSTEFYKWVKPFLKWLKQNLDSLGGEMPPICDMLSFLKKLDNEAHDNCPPSYDKLSYNEIKNNRYWFWRLDYYLWENRETLFDKGHCAAVEKYVFRSNRSIEHFHPQDENHTTTWSEGNIHSFGNLAMISQSFNSRQGNDHLQLKFDRIHEQLDNKTLQSLKLLKMCEDTGFDYKKWDEAKAREHGEAMYELLKKSFGEKPETDSQNLVE